MSFQCIEFIKDGTPYSYQWLDLTNDEMDDLNAIPADQMIAWIAQNAIIVQTTPVY